MTKWAMVWLCLMMSVARPAHAYLLSADFLMRLLADARREAPRAATLTLSTKLAGHDEPIEERLYFKRPERMRTAQVGEPGTISITREGLGAIGDPLGLGPVAPASNILASLLFLRASDLDAASERLLRILAGVGIDVTTVSLGRDDEQVVYIIGAKPWERDRPQLWLDKSNYLPVRLRLKKDLNATQPTMQERRFIDYAGGPVPGLPHILEEYQDDMLTRRSEVTVGTANHDLPESLFALTPPSHRRH